MRQGILATLLGCFLTLPAQAAPLWSIYWVSTLVGCDGWNTPVVSLNYPTCAVSAIPVSICPSMFGTGTPYGRNQPISIVGYQFSHILTDPAASGYAVMGSSHSVNDVNDGADVFASTAGVGSHTTAQMFASGLSLPQGGPAQSHIDVYGVCDKGQQQFLVTVFYTSP